VASNCSEAGLTGCDGSGPNPVSARAEDANRGSGVDPVLGAELLQWSRAAEMQWNDRPTAEPKLGAADWIMVAALGFAGRHFCGLGSRGVRGAN
jgi:hypothetical protein